MGLPTAVVVGAGSERGVGGAVSKRFAREGYHVLIAGRTPAKLEALVATIRAAGGSAEAIVADATQEPDVVRLFDRAMAPGDGREPADLVVFNAGDNALLDFLQTSADQFERIWRVGCFAGFLVGREAARRLVPLGRGTILFTGASGSLRGKPGFAHFAAAKAGLRAITQSMAREYGPKGIHVAHIVVDGAIDGDRIRAAAPAAYIDRLGSDGMLGTEGIADAYWYLHRQPRSTWTQELDLRPHKEVW